MNGQISAIANGTWTRYCQHSSAWNVIWILAMKIIMVTPDGLERSPTVMDCNN